MDTVYKSMPEGYNLVTNNCYHFAVELVAKLSVTRSEDQQGQNKEAGCLFGFKQIDDKIAFLINLFGV